MKYRPQALHTGSPFPLRLHRVVVVVWQFAQQVPARRAADCGKHTKCLQSFIAIDWLVDSVRLITNEILKSTLVKWKQCDRGDFCINLDE